MVALVNWRIFWVVVITLLAARGNSRRSSLPVSCLKQERGLQIKSTQEVFSSLLKLSALLGGLD